MIVTYAVNLRGCSGECTIVIPSIKTDNEESLLNYIKTSCEQHYNSSMPGPNYYLKNKDNLIILLIYEGSK